MSLYYTDTASTDEELVTTQQQQPDGVASTDRPDEKPRKSRGMEIFYFNANTCIH